MYKSVVEFIKWYTNLKPDKHLKNMENKKIYILLEACESALKQRDAEIARLQAELKEKEKEVSSKRMLLKELWFQVKTGQTVTETFLNTIETSFK